MRDNLGWQGVLRAGCCSLLYAAAGITGAAPFDLDPAYGTQGRVVFSTGQPQAQIARSVLQSDGKLIVTGARTMGIAGGTGKELFVRRFNVDGSPDGSFGTNGETRFWVRGDDTINMITLQADYKILLAIAAQEPCASIMFGVCLNETGQPAQWVSAVVRLRTDGMLDTTLGGSGIVEAIDTYGGYAVAVQADGKLLLLGTTSNTSFNIRNWRLTRFNVDGTRDAGFTGGSSASSRCRAFGFSLAVQPDGGIVVGGNDGIFYFDPAGNPGFCIERLSPDGSHDLKFNQGQLFTKFGINVTLTTLTVLPGGKLLAVGRGFGIDNSMPPSTAYASVVAARYNVDGTLDQAYGNGGIWIVPMAERYSYVGFTFARDGGIVAAGYDYLESPSGSPQQYRAALLKVTESGHVDAAFGVGGVARGAFGADIPVGFLRDLEDRWFLISTTSLPDLNAGGLIARYHGERPDSISVIEFFNTDLNHYFITASAAEAAGIDAGAAGPGWQRTGENFRAWQPAGAGSLNGVPQLSQTLCRFYGTPGHGPNSHFYTIDMPECESVRQDPGWRFEGLAFYAYAPLTPSADNSCPGELTPVYRVYNNRFAQNDSNHRYVASKATYQHMQRQGWTAEGVVFCAAAR